MRGRITILGSVPDPRTGHARRHDLLEGLTIALVAAICGCQTCVDQTCVEMAEFAEDREALFREFLRLEHGKTLRRSFDRAAGTSALHVVTAFATDTRPCTRT